MRDVALHAGVSHQTVSNYVNGRVELMGEDTRLRVEDAMTTLGYFVDQTARHLRSGRTRTLAFLVLDEHRRFLADPHTASMLAGVGDAARDHGYSILIQAARPRQRSWELISPVLEGRVDGALLVLSGPSHIRAWYVRQLAGRDASFVVFDEEVNAVTGVSIVADNRAGAVALTKHLLDAGHERIAFIAPRTPWPVVEQRHAGYRDALVAHGMQPDVTHEFFEGRADVASGAELTDRVLDADAPPTAIVAANDRMAIGAMRAVRRRGLAVPQDVGVAGFDEGGFAATLAPELAMVRVPAYEMGRAGAERLVDRLEGRPGDSLIRLAVELELGKANP